MNAKSMIKGTLILTITGLITRIMGFYYRIFLSNKIGAENLGLYQMIFPLLMLAHSLTSAGIQLVISRLVAVDAAHTSRKKHALLVGTTLSFILSIFVFLVLYTQADFLAINILSEERCAPLLRIMAFSVPLSSIHTCIIGYYYGQQKTLLPAFSNFTEQFVHIFAVWLLCNAAVIEGREITVSVAVYGLVLGEAGSTLLCLTALSFEQKGKFRHYSLSGTRRLTKIILRQGIPLTANRVLLNLLQSAEAILIPSRLQIYGLSSSESLAIYGLLTGMAMPFVLFPSTLTNAASTLLLPGAAEAQAEQNLNSLKSTIEQTLRFCLLLGIFCSMIFCLFGHALGNIIFQSPLCGQLLVILGWLCPFLYITSTFSSILHGLGKISQTFCVSVVSLSLRIVFVLIFIPLFSIKGYLWGILLCQILSTFAYSVLLYRLVPFRFDAVEWIAKPLGLCIISLFIGRGLFQLLPDINLLSLIFCIGCTTLSYCLLLIVTGLLPKPPKHAHQS